MLVKVYGKTYINNITIIKKNIKGFDCNLRAAVGLGEVGGRDAVFDVPLAHKILCDEGSKLWAII